MNLSVYICDNYGALRDLMRFALEDDARIQVVGEAEDAITCVRELPDARPKRATRQPVSKWHTL